jgi:hypothetical protein
MAARADMVVDQGANFETVVTVTDSNGDKIDLTNYTAAGQIRKHHTSSNATASFTITNGTTAGTLTLALNHANTAAISSGRYVYDVEILSAANVKTRVVEGIVTVTPEVTRA